MFDVDSPPSLVYGPSHRQRPTATRHHDSEAELWEDHWGSAIQAATATSPIVGQHSKTKKTERPTFDIEHPTANERRRRCPDPTPTSALPYRKKGAHLHYSVSPSICPTDEGSLAYLSRGPRTTDHRTTWGRED